MEAYELKKILSELKTGDRTWEDEPKVMIVKAMMEHIGSIDAELRDQLIYSSFYRLIKQKNLIEYELLTELLDEALNGLLWIGIGENGTDTVFTRSFTTLLIALILSRDNEDDFLDHHMVLQVKDKLLDYINLEKDLRGYVVHKGWAHSVAHVADTFDELVKSKKIDDGHYVEILHALWNKVLVSNSVYNHDEGERILFPMLEMLERGLAINEVEMLLEQIPNELRKRKSIIEEEEYWFLYSNCKLFLKSFLLKVQKTPKLYSLQKSIENCLQSEWNLLA